MLRPGRPAEFVIDLLQPVRFAGNVDSVVVLDASGQPLSMRGCSTRSSRASLVRGRSAVMGVGSQACTVVWYDDGVEVGRQPVVIHARSVEALGLPLDIQR